MKTWMQPKNEFRNAILCKNEKWLVASFPKGLVVNIDGSVGKASWQLKAKIMKRWIVCMFTQPIPGYGIAQRLIFERTEIFWCGFKTHPRKPERTFWPTQWGARSEECFQIWRTLGRSGYSSFQEVARKRDSGFFSQGCSSSNGIHDQEESMKK